jgi:CDP-glucose 4,6-dehydratase
VEFRQGKVESVVTIGARSILSEMETTFRGRRCLVTGHTGFKGAWLTQLLHRLGADVLGYALDPVSERDLFVSAGVADMVKDERGDIRDFDRLKRVVCSYNPEFVFHLAAQALVRRSYTDRKYTFDVNVGGTVNLLESVSEFKDVRSILIVTTDKVYNPALSEPPFAETAPLGGHDPYSCSKAAAELVTDSYFRSCFRHRAVVVTTARAGNVIGGGDWAEDRLIPDIVKGLFSGQPAEIRNPDAVRPWQHVLEPLTGYLMLAMEASHAFEHAEAVDKISGAWNFGPQNAQMHNVGSVVELFLQQMEAGQNNVVLCDKHQQDLKHETGLLMINSDKAAKYLNWTSRWNFEQTLKATADWYAGFQSGKSPTELCAADIESYWV